MAKPIDETILTKQLMHHLSYQITEGDEKVVTKGNEIDYTPILDNKNLLQELKNKCRPKYNDYIDHRSSKNGRQLGNCLLQTGQELNNEILIQAGSSILIAIESFNIEQIERLLDDIEVLFINKK